MSEISFVSTADQNNNKKKSSKNEKEVEKGTTGTISLNEYLFEKGNERKKVALTEENSCLVEILTLRTRTVF